MSRSKKETLQGEKRQGCKKKKGKMSRINYGKMLRRRKKNVKDKLWKVVKDKLWKDVEEKKKNFFNIFFFGEHITKSKNIDEYGNKSARIYTLCKAALA